MRASATSLRRLPPLWPNALTVAMNVFAQGIAFHEIVIRQHISLRLVKTANPELLELRCFVRAWIINLAIRKNPVKQARLERVNDTARNERQKTVLLIEHHKMLWKRAIRLLNESQKTARITKKLIAECFREIHTRKTS